jgi:hypothetical protein
MSTTPLDIRDTQEGAPDREEKRVLAALRGLRFGSVEVLVHDGRIVQIERREKVRLAESGRRQPDNRKRITNDIEGADRISGSAAPERDE